MKSRIAYTPWYRWKNKNANPASQEKGSEFFTNFSGLLISFLGLGLQHREFSRKIEIHTHTLGHRYECGLSGWYCFYIKISLIFMPACLLWLHFPGSLTRVSLDFPLVIWHPASKVDVCV